MVVMSGRREGGRRGGGRGEGGGGGGLFVFNYNVIFGNTSNLYTPPPQLRVITVQAGME